MKSFYIALALVVLLLVVATQFLRAPSPSRNYTSNSLTATIETPLLNRFPALDNGEACVAQARLAIRNDKIKPNESCIELLNSDNDTRVAYLVNLMTETLNAANDAGPSRDEYTDETKYVLSVLRTALDAIPADNPNRAADMLMRMQAFEFYEPLPFYNPGDLFREALAVEGGEAYVAICPLMAEPSENCDRLAMNFVGQMEAIGHRTSDAAMLERAEKLRRKAQKP